MKITVTSTDDHYLIDNVHVRLWLGKTEGGIDVQAIIQSVRVAPEDEVAFNAELGLTTPGAKAEAQPLAVSVDAVLLDAFNELLQDIKPAANIAYNLVQGEWTGAGLAELRLEILRINETLDSAARKARVALRALTH